jgi:CubicO group peptidase (beta-lactamase class C family)
VRHLMSHTSGLADYFQGTLPDGTSLEQATKEGSYVLETTISCFER